MGSNYQRPSPPKPHQMTHHHHSPLQTLQSLATIHNPANTTNTKDNITPRFHLPINNTYPSRLEIPEDENTPISSTATPKPTDIDTNQEATTTTSTSWTSTHDRNLSDEHTYSYVPITRPWKEQLFNEQGAKVAYSDDAQTPLVVWESQELIGEPFNNVGEVAVSPCGPGRTRLPAKVVGFGMGAEGNVVVLKVE